MKYLAILFLSLSLNAFSQQEQIFLQTSPEDQYVVQYTSGDYTFLFDYNDFLEVTYEDDETMKIISAWMDTKIQSQGFVILNASKTFSIGDETIKLQEVFSRRAIVRLIQSGNMIIEDASGRQTVSSLVLGIARTPETKSCRAKNEYTFTDPSTGTIVFKDQILGWRSTGCPSF